MSDLKDGLIKLAYNNPELRDDLLPIIKKHAAGGAVDKVQKAKDMLSSDTARGGDVKNAVKALDEGEMREIISWAAKKMKTFMGMVNQDRIMLVGEDIEQASKLLNALKSQDLKTLERMSISTELREEMPYEVWSFVNLVRSQPQLF